MTFLELAKLVRQECGIQGDGPSAVTSQFGLLKKVVEWTRDANTLIQSMHPDWDFLWKEFRTDTTQGSVTITKPTDFGMWDDESFAIDRGTDNGYNLRYIYFKEWRMNNSSMIDQQPVKITILPNNNLSFSAPADGTYELYANYWRSPLIFSADSDTPLFSERFHRAIIARAKMWFFEDVESQLQYEQAKIEFSSWIQELEDFALPERQPNSRQSPGEIVVRPE